MDSKTHILIIEDDPALARTPQTGLTRVGYDVTWKNDGTDDIAYTRDMRCIPL